MKFFLIKYLPFLGKYKRFLTAVFHSGITKKTYSQHGEDVFLLNYLRNKNLVINDYIYIDVGANHPTDISNTFLLYKNGMNGLIVEPNLELLNLFKVFRKKDTLFAIGVGNLVSMMKFYVSKTPVISSFVNDWRNSDVHMSYFVPIMTLDNALSNILLKPIFLLSIDVEGLNTEVLEGARETISKSILVCVEWDDIDQKNTFNTILGPNFKPLVDFGCNTIFENTGLMRNF
jgi:FkbM family methyltransferase